jgi:hypothetical protein
VGEVRAVTAELLGGGELLEAVPVGVPAEERLADRPAVFDTAQLVQVGQAAPVAGVLFAEALDVQQYSTSLNAAASSSPTPFSTATRRTASATSGACCEA